MRENLDYFVFLPPSTTRALAGATRSLFEVHGARAGEVVRSLVMPCGVLCK